MSTFSSLGSALSALRYNRVALDNASQNIANVGVEGYTRRRIESATAGAPLVPAMFSRSPDTNGGVRITGVTRMADMFLDARARTEHGRQSYLDVRQGVLDRLETGIGEPGENGLAAVMAEFRQAWGDLANNPANQAARSQVLARGAALVDGVQVQAHNFEVEAGDQRMRLNGMVLETNTVASDLAATNKAIGVAKMNGSDASTLYDQRDALSLRLSELTGGKGQINDSGGMDFAVGGVALVTGGRPGTLEVASGVTADGAADGSPVTFRIVAPDGASTTAVPAGQGGELGAVTEILDTTIPGYLAGLGAMAKEPRRQRQRGAPGRVRRGRQPGGTVLLLRPDRPGRHPGGGRDLQRRRSRPPVCREAWWTAASPTRSAS